MHIIVEITYHSMPLCYCEIIMMINLSVSINKVFIKTLNYKENHKYLKKLKVGLHGSL